MVKKVHNNTYNFEKTGSKLVFNMAESQSLRWFQNHGGDFIQNRLL